MTKRELLADSKLYLRWLADAPPRLPREVRGQLRVFFRRAHAALSVRRSNAPDDDAVIALQPITLFPYPDPPLVAAAKLGAPVPTGSVGATWRREREWGLNTEVSVINPLGTSYLISTHRFRVACKEAEFMRIMGLVCRVAISGARDLHDGISIDPYVHLA